jgi:hypothetical protein
MHEARAVLARLDRLDELAAADSPPAVLLAELHALAREAAEWARVEGDPAAVAAAAACLEALEACVAIVPA